MLRLIELFQRLQGGTSDSFGFATQTSLTVLQNARNETQMLAGLQLNVINQETLTDILCMYLYVLFAAIHAEQWQHNTCIVSRIEVTKNVVSIVVDLIFKIVSREDYLSVVDQLSQASDVEILLDFMLIVLRSGSLSNLHTTIADINRRARRFMLKAILRVPVIPPSLMVAAVTMPAGNSYIGGGGFGRVFKGELLGSAVALKVLYKPDNTAVSLSLSCFLQ